MTATNGTWKFVVWERLNKSGKWCPYSSEVSQFLESSFKQDEGNVMLGDVEDALKIYSVNLKEFYQISEKTGTKSTVRRRLCSNIDTLNNRFIWQWNDKDSWNSYDIDVNNFIEKAFQQGVRKVMLKKTFQGYNYEIDFAKLLQINKQTKRKRAIRRNQDSAPYPVEQCLDNYEAIEIDESIERNELEHSNINEYPELKQEVPGTSALVNQLQSYLRSVSGAFMPTTDETSSKPQPPTRKKKKQKHIESANGNTSSNVSKPTINTTYAIVSGKPWHEPWPPHTPSSKLKPVRGVESLSKIDKKYKKNKVVSRNEDDIFDLYTEEIFIDDIGNKDLANEVCTICYAELWNKSSFNEDSSIVKLNQCFHVFHKGCLEAMYESGPKDRSLRCPTCKKIHGKKCGIQPPGEMIYHVLPYSLPGFPDCHTIRVIYDIPSGIQGPEHPAPGKKYTARGFPRHCYFPDNEMGIKVLRLLIEAWKRRLIFTIGRSATTGEENTVTWNEIHHKTEFGCNRRGHGYPDPNFFDNILAELEAHGVT